MRKFKPFRSFLTHPIDFPQSFSPSSHHTPNMLLFYSCSLLEIFLDSARGYLSLIANVCARPPFPIPLPVPLTWHCACVLFFSFLKKKDELDNFAFCPWRDTSRKWNQGGRKEDMRWKGCWGKSQMKTNDWLWSQLKELAQTLRSLCCFAVRVTWNNLSFPVK